QLGAGFLGQAGQFQAGRLGGAQGLGRLGFGGVAGLDQFGLAVGLTVGRGVGLGVGLGGEVGHDDGGFPGGLGVRRFGHLFGLVVGFRGLGRGAAGQQDGVGLVGGLAQRQQAPVDRRAVETARDDGFGVTLGGGQGRAQGLAP